MTHLTIARRIVFLLALVLAAALHLSAQSVSQSELLFREALHKQQVEGDLGAAISLYQRIVATKDAPRAVVARALLQLGDCYEKQGKEEARRAYERLVRDFGDQSDAVRLARARLAELTPPPDARRDVVGRRLWEWSGARFVSTVSRDGRYAAIGDGRCCGVLFDGLRLIDLRSGTSRELGRGRRMGVPMVSSAVSPDGAHVAYTAAGGALTGNQEAGGPSVRIMSVTGDEPRILLKHPQLLSILDWSRDGSTLLLVEVIAQPQAMRAWFQRLLLFDVATARITPVGSPLQPELSSEVDTSFTLARLSPDARFIAYAARDGGDANGRGVVVVGADGSRPRRITSFSNFAYPLGWTPDGRRLLYVSDASGSYDLWSVAVEDGSPVGQPVVVKKAVGKIGGAGIDDNARLFYTSATLPGTAYFGELDVSAARVGNMRPVPNSGAERIVNVKWSPDGSRIHIVRVPFPVVGMSQWVRDAATGAEREIRPPEGYEYQVEAANWTPDGKSLVMFLRQGVESKLAWADVESGMFRIGRSVQSGQPLPLHFRDPIQSPDGRFVFAFRLLEQGGGDRRTALVRIDVDTGEQQEVCRGYGRISASPDTSHAACFDGDAIRLVTLQDGRARDLVKTDRPPDSITWTPDGRFIVYRQTQAQSPASAPARVTWIVPAAGGEPRRLDVPFGQQDLHFHPDGRHVATIDFEGSGELWMLENLKVD